MKEMTIIEKRIVSQAKEIIKKLRENGTVEDASNEERMVIYIAAKILKEKNKKELRKEKIKKWFDKNGDVIELIVLVTSIFASYAIVGISLKNILNRINRLEEKLKRA